MDRNDAPHNRSRPDGPLAIAAEPDSVLAARAPHDPAAFAELYTRYVDRIDQYCRIRLRDDHLAEDVTSQVFLKALEGLRRRRIDNVGAWLFTIAHNEVVNRYRHSGRDTTIERVGPLASPERSPEDLAIVQSEADALLRLLPRLGADQQRVIELRLAGLTTRDIQQVLGRSQSWIDTTQHRALRRLRALLDDPQGGTP
jgi:RNA polymerase sigma-70 factor (ECF subfamily)